ncbi:MAG: rRNA maturation RNase YbeY [Bacilli bacterium]|nr:rRNA maturation RNase YbeY [Bacilli bacterium]MBR6137672.1 rRNA maturation RNase YbeY [Bacilli bacterium]
MSSNIEIFVQVDEDIKELETVEKVLYSAIEKEKLENVSFNLIIVDNNYIHELNKTYRHIDRETDVITFALEDEDTIVLPNEERILGDIYISIDRAREQAKEYGHSLLRELSFLAVHGFYHLLGYDHQTPEEEKVMFTRQEEVLDSYGIRRES